MGRQVPGEVVAAGMVELVAVEPRRLRFVRPGEAAGQPHTRRRLTVTAQGQLVAFKLQTNASKRFNVQPAQGYLRPGQTQDVVVKLKHGAGWSEADKFLVRAMAVATTDVPVHEVWAQGDVHPAQKVVVRCDYHAAVDVQADVPQGTGVAGHRAVPAEAPEATSPDPHGVSARQREMLIKNLSDREEDRLTREELEDLQKLREKVGPAAWAELQQEAREEFARRSAASGTGNADAMPEIRALGSALGGSLGVGSSSGRHTTGGTSLSDVLSRGVAHLRAREFRQSVDTFSSGLKAAPQGSVERAQMLVGLASTLEATGVLDQALEQYIEALRIYDQLGDVECKDSVASAIAHVYADMRDHTMAAAWFDYEHDLLSPEPSNGARRASCAEARDHQIKLGHVTTTLLAAARGRIASQLASGRSRKPSVAASLERIAAVTGGASRLPTPSIGPIETLWEPSQGGGGGGGGGGGSGSSPRPEALASNGLGHHHGQTAGRARGPLGSGMGNGGTPHFMAATTASRASRVSSGSLAAALPAEEPLPQPVRRASLKPSVVDRRNREAAAQHVRRALEARRKKAQESGARAPAARRLNASEPTGAAWSPRTDSAELVVLKVASAVDGQHYSVALPGPLEKALDLTVREMRERVSFVTGVDLHDFELAVDGTPLTDSWRGRDIGIGAATEVDLRLLPGVRSNKYIHLVRSPIARSQQQQQQQQPQADERPTAQPQATPAPPRRKPPPPVEADAEAEAEAEAEARAPMLTRRSNAATAAAAPGEAQGLESASGESDLDEGTFEDAGLAALCSGVRGALGQQRRAEAYADELRDQAQALLDSGEDRSTSGASTSAESLVPDRLFERLRALERELAGSTEAQEGLSRQLDDARAKILDLAEEKESKKQAREELAQTVASLRAEHSALATETRAILSNFGEILRQNILVLRGAEPNPPVAFALTAGPGGAQEDRGGPQVVALSVRGDEVAEDEVRELRVIAEATLQSATAGEEDALADAAETVLDGVITGRCDVGFFVNLGPRFYFRATTSAAAALFVPDQVAALFDELTPEQCATTAHALGLQPDGTVVDLLAVRQDEAGRKEVEVGAGEGGALRLVNAVAVQFRQHQEFLRLFGLLQTRLRPLPTAHLVLVLQNEQTARRLVFVDVHSESAVSGALSSVLGAAGAQEAEAVVLIGEEPISSSAAASLERFFPTLLPANR